MRGFPLNAAEVAVVRDVVLVAFLIVGTALQGTALVLMLLFFRRVTPLIASARKLAAKGEEASEVMTPELLRALARGLSFIVLAGQAIEMFRRIFRPRKEKGDEGK